MKDISAAGQQQCASVKLRRKKEETKSSRRSVDYRKRSEKCDSNDNLDTLDHVTDIIEMKNNLRQALRSKYKVEDCVQIKHFGYIDQPAEECGGPVSLPALSAIHNNNNKNNHLGTRSSSSTMMRGVLWIHRDRYFSRWKERFIVLTRDYLQCYKRVVTEASQMGPFISQIRLSDVSHVSLVDRKGYLTLLLELNKEDNLVLRRAENIREWYTVILGLVSDTRSRMMQNTESFWRKTMDVREMEDEKITAEEWLVTRRTPVSGYFVAHTERDRLDNNNRPPSVASVDRRHRHRQRHRRRAKSHTPGQAMSHVSGVSACHSAANLRSVSVDRDSGNYSLQTSSDRDTRNIDDPYF